MKHTASLEFKKLMVRGEPVFRFISCEGLLRADELPKSYIMDSPSCWFMEDWNGVETREVYYRYGDDLTQVEYKDFTKYLTECGKRLTEILIDKAQIRKTHSGTVVFKV